MQTIKIIELLNKIANGEDVPEKIKYRDEIFYYKEDMTDYSKGEYYYLFDRGFRYKTETFLNEEIEIIENTDNKIEKIGKGHYIDDEEVLEKIDEIIDYINNNHIPRID